MVEQMYSLARILESKLLYVEYHVDDDYALLPTYVL